VLVGDGRSDFCAAAHADVVFARASLLEHCRARGIPCVPFETFDAVGDLIERSILEPIDRLLGEPASPLAAGR
jgi:2-hydroxy-3-keto-5-methylthiopentenyl-1-phosphate phosphatase